MVPCIDWAQEQFCCPCLGVFHEFGVQSGDQAGPSGSSATVSPPGPLPPLMGSEPLFSLLPLPESLKWHLKLPLSVPSEGETS